MVRSQNSEPRTIFTDTHCHIHDREFFPYGGRAEYERALQTGVHQMICVGTDIRSSRAALEFAMAKPGCFAAIGIHPHEAEQERGRFSELQELAEASRTQNSEPRTQNSEPKTLVAIGEIGLDYHYMYSPRDVQIALFEQQLDLAIQLQLPVSFHVREAFEDFWPVLRNFSGVRGVLHSFTDEVKTMEKGLEEGLYIGVNGIATFARDREEVVRAMPLERMLLETDAPYLTPKPLRGTINEPGNLPIIGSYVAELRDITVEELSRATEAAASRLFFEHK